MTNNRTVKNNSLNYNIIQQDKREKEMTVKEFYEAIEGNYNEAKDRMMNEGLILKFSLKFAEDKSFGDLKSALGRNDIGEAFRAIHTLKGVSGNMAYTKLYNACCDLTENLRPLTEPVNEELLKRVEEAYGQVMDNIVKLDR